MSAFNRVFPTTAAPHTGGPSASRRIGPFTEKQLAIGGVVAAVGLGLYSARRTKKAGTSGNLGTGAGASIEQGAYDPSTGAIGTYDSTANDVYDALQPQVEAVAGTTAGIATLNTTLTGLPSQISSAIQASVPRPAAAGKPRHHKAAPHGKKPKSKPKAAHPAHPAHQGAHKGSGPKKPVHKPKKK